MSVKEQSQDTMKGLDALAQHFDHPDESPEPAPLTAAMRSGLRFLPPFFHELAEKGVSFNMEGLSGIFHVDGFYRNGPMQLQVMENDDIIAIDKNNKKTLVRNYGDLLKLNFQWWVRSSTRSTYVIPHKPWINDFMKDGLVERKVIYVPLHEQDDREEDEKQGDEK